MNALVTGAGGFIGKFLCEALIGKGYHVKGLFLPDEDASGAERMGVTILRGDLTRPETLTGISGGADLIFHLAARVVDWGSDKTFRSIMVDGTRNLLETIQTPLNTSMKDFHNKIVYITGGSSGIGLEIARLMAAQGAHLAIFARDPKKLETAHRQIRNSRRNIRQKSLATPVDVGDVTDLERKMRHAVKEIGAPDILINSAGIVNSDYFENISLHAFDAVMKTNVYGIRNVIAALLPEFKKKRRGHIVNIASAAGLMGVFGYTAYGTSKYAVVGFSECLRTELKPHNILVSVVCPPEVETPMIAQESKTIPAEAKALKQMAGVLQPEHVAQIVIKGIKKQKFKIIPGRLTYFLYRFQCIEGGALSRSITDRVVRHAIKRKKMLRT